MAAVLVCEKTLQEKDDVFTPVRLVDLFRFAAAETPSQVAVSAIAILKAIGPTEDIEHQMWFSIENPHGQVLQVTEPNRFRFVVADSKIPYGLNAPLHIWVPTEPGTSYIIFNFDGSELARAPFTLQQTEPAPATGA